MRARVGDFVVSGPECGHGAYGRVLSAKNQRTGESVACKVIGPVVHDIESDKEPAVSEAEIYASANAEVEALRRLQAWPHRNVIGFRGDHLLHTPRGPATLLFLELAEGGDLVDMLLKAPGSLLSEDVARDYFRQMTAGVQHMHSMGVTHRDIKLDNVVLTSEGVVKWIDFGFAHVHPEDPEGGYVVNAPLARMCGSPSYVAPEVRMGGPYNGSAADTWSLGVSLFTMVCGFFPLASWPPLDGGRQPKGKQYSLPEMTDAQRQGLSTTHAIFAWYKLSCHLSPELIDLIDGMLCVVPSCRLSLDDVAASRWLNPETPHPTELEPQSLLLVDLLSKTPSGTSDASCTTTVETEQPILRDTVEVLDFLGMLDDMPSCEPSWDSHVFSLKLPEAAFTHGSFSHDWEEQEASNGSKRKDLEPVEDEGSSKRQRT